MADLPKPSLTVGRGLATLLRVLVRHIFRQDLKRHLGQTGRGTPCGDRTLKLIAMGGAEGSQAGEETEGDSALFAQQPRSLLNGCLPLWTPPDLRS